MLKQFSTWYMVSKNIQTMQNLKIKKTTNIDEIFPSRTNESVVTLEFSQMALQTDKLETSCLEFDASQRELS